MDTRKRNLTILTCGFWLGAAAYFVNYELGAPNIAVNCIVKTFPVFFLSIAVWLMGRKSMALLPFALYFSAIGDLAGELHLFICQVAAFAVAQGTYASAFLERSKPTRVSFALEALLIAVSIAISAAIFPYIDRLIEKIFCVAYMALITFMAGSSLVQSCRLKWYYVAAALVFLFSDTIIAWNRFVNPVPYETYIIMLSYFTAQFGFAFLYIYEQDDLPVQE